MAGHSVSTRPRLGTKATLFRLGLMVLGMVAIALAATPALLSAAWVTVLTSWIPYVILSFLVLRQSDFSNLLSGVVRSLAYVATPSLVVFLLIMRGATELIPWYAIAGVIVLCGGAAVGATMVTLLTHYEDGTAGP